VMRGQPGCLLQSAGGEANRRPGQRRKNTCCSKVKGFPMEAL